MSKAKSAKCHSRIIWSWCIISMTQQADVVLMCIFFKVWTEAESEQINILIVPDMDWCVVIYRSHLSSHHLSAKFPFSKSQSTYCKETAVPFSNEINTMNLFWEWTCYKSFNQGHFIHEWHFHFHSMKYPQCTFRFSFPVFRGARWRCGFCFRELHSNNSRWLERRGEIFQLFSAL